MQHGIDLKNYKYINSDRHSLGNHTTLDALQLLFQIYGHIGPDEIKRINEKLNASIQLGQPLALLWKQLKEGQTFVTAASILLTQQQIIYAADTITIGMIQYKIAYQEWLALPSM
eukprot:15366768-Ditylum_brightwellii.AAC.1